MRLKSIEAVRFGTFSDVRLGELGEGLTVICGPNESGKTTFTTLVRHILFGYPDARTKERSYAPASGDPHGRLVFSDEAGEWSIERAGKAKRGSVRVETLRGEERPMLLDEIIGGVSEQTFQIVYGFGLDDLPSVGPGGPDNTIARIYAAESGTGVSPIDVQSALRKAAAEEYSPSASKPTVNALASSAKALRTRIRELENQALEVAGEQQEAARLQEEIEPLRQRKAALDLAYRKATDDLKELRAAAKEATETEEALASLRSMREALDREAPAAPDGNVLNARAEIEALLAGMSGWEQRIVAAERKRQQARQHAAAREGLGPLADEAADDPGTRAEVARRSQLLAEARAAQATASERARASEARARGFDSEAGVSRRAAKGQLRIMPWLTAAAGAAAIVAGVLSGQWVAAALGAVVLVIGVAAAFVAPSGSTADELVTDARRMRAEAQADADVADAMAARLAEETAEWARWLAERHLDAFGAEPSAVVELLERLAQRESFRRQESAAADEAAAESALAGEWEERLRVLASRVAPAVGADVHPAAVAAQLRLALDAAVAAQAELEAHAGRAREMDQRLQDAGARLEAVRARVAEVAARNDLTPEDAEPSLEAIQAQSSEELETVSERYEETLSKLNQLLGSLNAEGRDSEMTRARQELEGIEADIAEHAERYLVYSLADRLMTRTREVYEKERQPEIVRIAADVFSAITEGRYSDIRLPMGGQELIAIAPNGATLPTGQLSRGTADQLYLAVRVGLIGAMRVSGVHLPVLMDDIVVNFDADRRAGAAKAVALLAKERQVVYFTCHEETAAQLMDAAPGATRIDLARCSLGG